MAGFEYVYHDWADEELYPSAADRYARLNKHISEVSALMLPDTSGTDHSVSIKSLKDYHANLLAERRTLKEEIRDAGFNPLQRVRKVRG